MHIFQLFEEGTPLRIGWMTSEMGYTPLPPCQRAVTVARDILMKQGHTVSATGSSEYYVFASDIDHICIVSNRNVYELVCFIYSLHFFYLIHLHSERPKEA